MGNTISYEVYAYKSGNWNIDSVYDDKTQALHEARLLLESRHLTGVKIIQENFNEETGKTASMIIFNEVKHLDKPKPRPAPAVKKKAQPTAQAAAIKPRRKSKGADPIIKLVLILGGICLGLLALVAFYVMTFG